MEKNAEQEMDQQDTDEEEISVLTAPVHNEQPFLGTRYCVQLVQARSGNDLADGEHIPLFLARLPVSTTLTELAIDFYDYDLVHQDNLRVVQPICECLANLQRQHHPLRKLEIIDMMGKTQLYSDALQRLLIAAKQFGIAHLKLSNVHYIPIVFLVEFCRDNRHLNVLELDRVIFSQDNDEGVSSVDFATPTLLTLDKLMLNKVRLENPIIATNFANFVHAANVTALSLGHIFCHYEEFTMKVVSSCIVELVKPSVQQLKLLDNCKIKHFRAALNAATGTFLMELDVSIDCNSADATAKLDVLREFIYDAVQLESLTILANPQTVRLLPRLVETMEACSTITRLEVHIHGRRGDGSIYSADEEVASAVQQLRLFEARNEQLALLQASPNTYPNDQLLDLVRQFDNCPTGRYGLVRSLPEMFTFQRGNSLFPLDG